MIANLKYEFIKLLTIRSTYVMTILSVAFAALIMIVTVIKTPNLATLTDQHAFNQMMLDGPGIASLIAALAAILIVGHEYRHNTIAYTLTASRSRLKIMLSKLLATIAYSVTLSLLTIIVVLICFYVGITIRDASLALPTIEGETIIMLLRSLFFCVGLALLALLVASLVRNIVFAVGAFFLLPTIEQFTGIFLKDNVVYLPAAALDQVAVSGTNPIISPLKGALIFLAYLAVGSVISYMLFVRRDAN